MRARVVVALSAAFVVSCLLVAGAVGLLRSSGVSGGESASGASAASADGYGPPQAAAPAAGVGSAGGAGGADLAKAGTVAERDIVRTAQLSVTVDDPDAAADRATALATGAGGRVETDDRDATAHLVLRVRADRLDATLTGLAALGTETGRQVQGDDVTAQTADLGARVQALQTSVDRLRTLIATSGSLGDLLSVETQLTQRQAELESLQAQQRALADQVALATVTVTFTTPAVAAAAAGPTGFGGAVEGGWHGFTVAVRYLLAGLGYALPFLLLAAAGLGVVVLVRRRRRRPPVQPPVPSSPSP